MCPRLITPPSTTAVPNFAPLPVRLAVPAAATAPASAGPSPAPVLGMLVPVGIVFEEGTSHPRRASCTGRPHARGHRAQGRTHRRARCPDRPRLNQAFARSGVNGVPAFEPEGGARRESVIAYPTTQLRGGPSPGAASNFGRGRQLDRSEASPRKLRVQVRGHRLLPPDRTRGRGGARSGNALHLGAQGALDGTNSESLAKSSSRLAMRLGHRV